jgi:sugar phosphate permease
MSHKLHYAWVVAAVTFVTLVVTAAVRATPSILIVPLEHEFGWSPATARIFGTRDVGLIFGWVIAAHQIGAAVIALLAGFIRSIDGSYDLAFLISGFACIAAALGVLLIGRTSDSGFLRRRHKIQQPATAQQY